MPSKSAIFQMSARLKASDFKNQLNGKLEDLRASYGVTIADSTQLSALMPNYLNLAVFLKFSDTIISKYEDNCISPSKESIKTIFESAISKAFQQFNLKPLEEGGRQAQIGPNTIDISPEDSEDKSQLFSWAYNDLVDRTNNFIKSFNGLICYFDFFDIPQINKFEQFCLALEDVIKTAKKDAERLRNIVLELKGELDSEKKFEEIDGTPDKKKDVENVFQKITN